MANQTAASSAGAGAGAAARAAPAGGAPFGAIEGSSFLDACSARSSRSLSMASVLSVSLSRFSARAAGAGFEADGAGGDDAAAGRKAALGAPSAGSEMPIFAPQ